MALGDPLRLGHVYVTLSTNCWVTGEVDRAIDYGQRTLALADTPGAYRPAGSGASQPGAGLWR